MGIRAFSTSKLSLAFLSATSSITAVSIANAQTEPPANEGASVARDDSGVREIVVTAQKRAESINDVGLSITALSGDALARQNISGLSDIAQAVPGLSYTEGTFNAPVFTLRGIGFYETTLAAYPAVSVYLDEVPLAFPVLTKLTAFDLERIEVLKGPQGTLFGQNSTGGAINYIAAKPTEEFRAGASLTYGRFNTIESEAYISGPLAPNLTARLSGRIAHGDAWQVNYVRDDKTGKTETYAGRLLIDWEPSDRLRFSLNVNGWKDKSDPITPQYTAPFPQQPQAAPDYFMNYPVAPDKPRAADWSLDNEPFANNRLYQIALRTDWDVADDITLTSISAYVNFRKNQSEDVDGTSLDIIQFYSDKGYIKSFSQELRLANGGQAPLRWVVGGNYEYTKTLEDLQQTFSDSSTTAALAFFAAGFRNKQKLENYAAFGNVEYDVSPQFTLKAGARYTKANRSSENCGYDPDDSQLLNAFFTGLSRALTGENVPALGPGDCYTLLEDFRGGPPFRGELNEDNLSWRVGVDYKPTDGVLLYGNIAKGYKAGSFTTAAAATYLQYFPVTQESVLSYEIGTKLELLQRRLVINAAAYYYDYKDKQLRSKLIDPIFGVNEALVNIPKSTIKGAELQVTLVPIPGLVADVSATYTRAKIDEFIGVNGSGNLDDFAGFTMPFTPKYQLSGSLDYEWDMGGLSPFIGASVSAKSKSVSVVGGEAEIVNGQRLYQMDGYTLVDLRAGIKDSDDKWEFMLFGKNVFNKYYLTNRVTLADAIVRYPGRPATYGATIRVKY